MTTPDMTQMDFFLLLHRDIFNTCRSGTNTQLSTLSTPTSPLDLLVALVLHLAHTFGTPSCFFVHIPTYVYTYAYTGYSRAATCTA